MARTGTDLARQSLFFADLVVAMRVASATIVVTDS